MKRACELLKVSRSAYYQHRAAGPSPRQRVDTELAERIAEVHEASAGAYGSPRVHAELRAQGRRHSRKRIARLMRTAALCGRDTEAVAHHHRARPSGNPAPGSGRPGLSTSPAEVDTR